MNDEEVNALKKLVSKAFWRGMDTASTATIAMFWTVQSWKEGCLSNPIILGCLILMYGLAIIEGMAYLGLHKKIERVRDLEKALEK